MRTQAGRLGAAGVAAALSGALFALEALLPVVGYAASLASPLPVAWMARERTALGTVAAVGATLLVAALFGADSALTYLLQFGAGGVVIGVAVRQNWKPDRAVGLYAALFLAAFIAFLGAAALVGGASPSAFLADSLAKIAEEAKKALATASNVTEAERADVARWVDLTLAFVRRGIFGIIAAYGILVGWLNATALRRALRSRGEQVVSWARWRSPDLLIWAVIAAGVMTLTEAAPWVDVGLNILIVAGTIYFLQGLAVIQFLFEVKNVPVLVRVAIYSVFFLAPQSAFAVVGVGAFDLWVNWRRRFTSPPKEA